MKMECNEENDWGLLIEIEICSLAMSHAYFKFYNTNITHFLAAISNCFNNVWLMSCTDFILIYFSTLGVD